MTPLGGALLGMVMVAFDFRVNTLDLVADPIGWVLIAVFVGRLAERSPWLRAASAIAWVGAVASLPAVLVDTQQVLALTLVDIVLETAVLFCLCTGMMALLEPGHPAKGPLNAIRWVDLATTVVVVMALPVSGGVAAAVGLVAVLVAVAVAIGFAVLLFQLRHHPAFTVARPAAPPGLGSRA